MSNFNPVFQISDAVTSRRFCLQIPIHKFIKLMFNRQTSALMTNINFKKHVGRIFITVQVRLSNTSVLQYFNVLMLLLNSTINHVTGNCLWAIIIICGINFQGQAVCKSLYFRFLELSTINGGVGAYW